MEKTIKIISKKVGEMLVREDMVHTLENMQKKVGGYLEVVRFPLGIDMWVNDEGLIHGLPLNLVIIRNGKVVSHICGNVFFASANEEGETIGLNLTQEHWIKTNLQFVGFAKGKDELEYTVYGIAID